MPYDAMASPARLLFVRAATAADARTIRRMIRAAGINPMGLHWPNFVIVEDAGCVGERVVGVGQVKQHGDGSRELASLAVLPEVQGHGIGGVIIHTLLAREPGPLYLTCREGLAGYYARFGFRRVTGHLPPYLRRLARLARAIVAVARMFDPAVPGMAVMFGPGSGGPPDQAMSGSAGARSSGPGITGEGNAAPAALPAASQGISSPAAPM